MTPSVEVAGMARRAFSGLVVAAGLLAATPALAGDRAQIGFLGFSDDGRFFAFEEFGVQDGSGFPFSTIFIIDLPADAWVTGSPYRVTLEDDGADVEDARDQASDLAEAKLDELDISVAANLTALNGDAEDIGDGHTLVFGPAGYGLEPIQAKHELALDTIALEPGMDCAIIDDETYGFALSLDGEEVYADEGPLPASRGCAMDYRIYAIVTVPDWHVGERPVVAIISAYPFGFEGPDRRFIAVPLPN